MHDINTRDPAEPGDDFKIISFEDLSDGRLMLDFLESDLPVRASVFHGPECRLCVILQRPLDDKSTISREWLSPPDWWRPLGMRKDIWRAAAILKLSDPPKAISEGWKLANGQRVRV